MMKRATGLLLCFGLLLLCGRALAQDKWVDEEGRIAEEQQLDSVENTATTARSPFAISAKMGWHWFWNTGVFLYSFHPYYDVSSSDLQGLNGELDFDYFFREWLVFTVTTGGYGASLSKYGQDYITGYGLLSAKIQRTGPFVDYYVGAGFGAYLARVSNNVDTAYALQPGIHALLGMRFHVTPAWSILLENRFAFTLKAQGLFSSLDLGGNHLFLGGSYRF
jgi:hypothetical protein